MRVRDCLLRSTPSDEVYVGRKLAVIFPSAEDWAEDMYFTTGKDRNHGSFEKEDSDGSETSEALDDYQTPIVRTPLDDITYLEADNFDVTWKERDEPWYHVRCRRNSGRVHDFRHTGTLFPS
ncbi:hypothetical protein IFR04_006904 [Cadophora malorum]|uniref:Uncharacterized protein n=1 Tax=Cadophora malorum TaxID=108018 RepID=A0A8H7THT7_9HELO|nr:hypothetical protein IFR04_006904 [Cadophora malorum]